MIRFRPPRRAVLAAGLGLALLTGPAASAEGFDFKSMTPAEQADFGQAVRAYLMAHPEVLVEAIDKLQTRQAEAQAAGDAALVKANAQEIFHDPSSWVGGNPEGDVTLVEFMDYRCGYCRKAFPDIARMLKADGKIRFIVKELPILTPDSVIGARYALAVRQIAGDAAYAKAHDALMVLNGPLNEAALTRLSQKIGVDFGKVKPAMTSPEVAHILARNSALADRLQVNGTPTFVLGDQLLRGYLPYAQLQALVAQTRREEG